MQETAQSTRGISVVEARKSSIGRSRMLHTGWGSPFDADDHSRTRYLHRKRGQLYRICTNPAVDEALGKGEATIKEPETDIT